MKKCSKCKIEKAREDFYNCKSSKDGASYACIACHKARYVVKARKDQVPDRTGLKYGRLLVLSFAGRNEKSDPIWLCRCDCGKEVIIKSKVLAGYEKNNNGCGCLWKTQNSKTSVNGKHAPVHVSWRSMMLRCYNEQCGSFTRYGEKGITVEPRWHTFMNFYEDMGEPPPGHTLDRIDNTAPYSADNCRWASLLDQAKNKKHTIKLTYLGKTQTLREWAAELNIKHKTIWERLKKGWPVEEALEPTIWKNQNDKISAQNAKSAPKKS